MLEKVLVVRLGAADGAGFRGAATADVPVKFPNAPPSSCNTATKSSLLATSSKGLLIMSTGIAA